MLYEQLDTPCLLINLDIVEKNLRRVADFALEQGVALRPHAKTHKIPALARMQIESGAVGICSAKLSEAEVMLNGGIKDIFIANQIIGSKKLSKLIELSRRPVRLSSAVDSLAGAAALNHAMQQAELWHDVLIEIDTGLNRCGLADETDRRCDEILKLAAFIISSNGLRLKGIYTHEGHINSMIDRNRAEENALRVGQKMVQIAESIRAAGFDCPTVSVGATSVYRVTPTVPGVTEMRPGTYIFNDAGMVAVGAADWNDCAVSILCSVISRPAANRAVIDAGSKTFSSDKYPFQTSFGAFKYRPELSVTWLNEEHGVIIGDVSCLKIGDKVEILPNHVCSAVNMHDQAVAVRKGHIEAVWEIEARGKLT
ncbi:alanine racemase [candidate division KSB1 bacterium]|nr:alanine racemase [candidate division KSB1 bacterium]